MSKRLAYILSAVLAVLLAVLFVCEIRWPEAGSAILGGLFG